MANNILKQSLDFLKVKVDTYNGSVTSIVEISNIATLNDGDEFLESTSPIVLSVINIEEDTVAKTPNVYKTNNDHSSTVEKHKNPTQHFITSLLFTAYIVLSSVISITIVSNLVGISKCFTSLINL